MIITLNFYFRGGWREALKLYEKAFIGKLTMCLHYSDANPSDISIAQLSDKEKSMYIMQR